MLIFLSTMTTFGMNLSFSLSIGNSRLPNRVYSSGQKHNLGFLSSQNVHQELGVLWNDGHGSQNVKDYVEALKSMLKCDDGPPRWFCPLEAGPPLKNSPLLLYLPGIDGIGMGMMLHHKAMGKVFEVRCLHIPIRDRTSYEGLVKFVEKVVRDEHDSCPNKPVYLVGDSFGGCIALSVAASNPTIDVVLILVNPATSFNRSNVYHLSTISSTLGDEHKLSIAWKLKLLKSGAASSNSRIHNIQCETLVLASGKDAILPSLNEAERLAHLIKRSKVRVFENNGHALLLEDGINLLTVIKGVCMYRRSRKHDPVSDFVPPSQSEHNDYIDTFEWFRVATSPVFLSTLGDGKIVRGLQGVPDEGPVLLVGYHMLLGSEISFIVDEFLREKHVMIHGLAHPGLFTGAFESMMGDNKISDYMRLFGAMPVTARNLLRLLSNKSYALLYPGGIREALHRKGEKYKLFWPENPEFVRIAMKCKAKIVPFGVVGEDDIIELFLDYNDLMRIPLAKDMIKKKNANLVQVRDAAGEMGEVSNQDFFVPGFYPKIPGRFYFLFGKAVETKGKEEVLKNKEGAKDFYEEIKCEVERNIAYLMKKREEDPYRHVLERLMHKLVSAKDDTPTFDP